MALRGAHLRGPRLLAPAVVLLALVVAAVAPAAARATLLVDHVQATTAVDGGGLMGPGKSFALDETINNSESSLTNVTGQLSSSSPDVTIDQASSPYSDLTFGQQGTNTTHFHAGLAGTAECGTTLPFTLHVNADQGQQ